MQDSQEGLCSVPVRNQCFTDSMMAWDSWPEPRQNRDNWPGDQNACRPCLHVSHGFSLQDLSLLLAICPSSASPYGALTSCPLLSMIPPSKCIPTPRKQHIARGGLHGLPLQHVNMPRHLGGSAASAQPLQQPSFPPFLTTTWAPPGVVFQNSLGSF